MAVDKRKLFVVVVLVVCVSVYIVELYTGFISIQVDVRRYKNSIDFVKRSWFASDVSKNTTLMHRGNTPNAAILHHSTDGFTGEDNVPSAGAFDPIGSLAYSKLQQFQEFSRLYPNFKFQYKGPALGRRNQSERQEIYNSYRYTTKHWTMDGYVFSEVMETYKGNITKGGSSLFCTANSSTKSGIDWIVSLCTYRDYMNGSYVVQCPAYANDVYVTIHVLDVHYHQFMQVIRELDIAVTKETFNSSVILQKPKTYWSQKRQFWTWHSSGLGQSTHASEHTADMCKAAIKMDKLYMIGSSHMRYQYHYLLAECHHLDKNFWKRLVFVQVQLANDLKLAIRDFANESLHIDCDNNTEFYSNFSTTYFADIWKEEETRDLRFQFFVYQYTVNTTHGRNTDQNVVICKSGKNMKIGMMIQVGSHDLSLNPMKSNFEDLNTSLKETLKLLQPSKYVNILVTGPPPFNSKQLLKSGRSNDDIAIYDRHLMKITKEINLPFFSIFEMVYLRYRHCEPKSSHYILCNPRTHECRGNVGKLAFQEAFRVLTDQFS